MGNVYRRQGSKKRWIKYLQHGRVIRESTETENLVEARRLLRNREGQVAHGMPVAPDVGRITLDEATKDILNDYAMNQKKTLQGTKRLIELHLAPYFGNRRLNPSPRATCGPT